MAKIAMSKAFFAELPKLSKDVQRKALTMIQKFQEDPDRGGLNLERHNCAIDPRARTVRVDRFWRAIVAAPESGSDTYILFGVKSHDDAERWMASNRFSVNALTGGVEVINDAAIEAAATRSSAVPEASQQSLVRPLSERRDKEFRQLGIVDPNLIGAVRTLSNDDQVLAVAELLPPDQAEALTGLAAGESVDEIYGRLVAAADLEEVPKPVEPIPVEQQNLGVAAASSASSTEFRVLDGSEELGRALEGSFEAWRIFLHPSQRAAVERDYSGPARVTGGAGTGKTVALVHRARRLASADPDARILVTTFNRRLAHDLEDKLRQLGGAALADRISVSTVDALAHRVVSEVEEVRVLDGRAYREALEDAYYVGELDELGLDTGFLQLEWEQVVLAQAIRSRRDYFSAVRTGRGSPLRRRERAMVWRAVEALEGSIAAAGKATFLQLAERASQLVGEQSVKPYDHMLVDEAQDLHPAQWRLLRACVNPGRNDLFITGDTHQRIYAHRVSLNSLGIEIRGRSTRLKLNYRTTKQILRWALTLIGDGRFDDLDDGSETLLGYRSATEGPPPGLYGAESGEKERDAVAKLVAGWLADGVEAGEIGVCARTNERAEAVKRVLVEAGLPAGRRGSGEPLYVDTMHSMKGLEFRRVVMSDIARGSVPLPAAMAEAGDDPALRGQAVQRERCLLYVAATRAREQLYVSWSKQPSSLLPEAVGQ